MGEDSYEGLNILVHIFFFLTKKKYSLKYSSIELLLSTFFSKDFILAFFQRPLKYSFCAYETQ